MQKMEDAKKLIIDSHCSTDVELTKRMAKNIQGHQ